jgi:ABC-type nitrate/sulfonate/bicarbonate transport system ATPase subunit
MIDNDGGALRTAKAPVVRLEGVRYGFSPTDSVMQDLSLCILPGEFVAVVGPSGCGKTTLLNLLAGDMAPTEGRVEIQGRARRVFQQDGLFPWRTVSENISLGLRRDIAAGERARQIAEMLALIGLEAFADHYPHQLSGGMRQRVELARALSGESDILLMDEPFSALDYLTRLRLRRELARLLAEKPRTVVLVTHDIEEAAQLADRIVVLSERPSRARFDHPISLPRPREATDPAIVETVRLILTEMGL